MSLISVATATLLVYDYTLTLERELRLIWPTPWSLIKLLFLLTRYLPFLNILVVVFRDFNETISQMGCRVSIILSGGILILGIGASEVILCVRTWALWNRSKGVAIMLGLVCAAAAIVIVVVYSFWVVSLAFGSAADIEGAACYVIKQNKLDAAGIGLVVVLELIVITLTLIHLIHQYRWLGRKTSFSGVLGILYRDGIIYFIYLLAFSVADFLIMWFGANSIKIILLDLQHVIHSALTSRVLFHLREATSGHEGDDGETLSQVSSNAMFACPLSIMQP